MSIVEYSFPTRILFGPGVSERIQSLFSGRRPLIVTDKGFSKLEVYKDFRKNLPNEAEFSRFEGNPLESHVTDGVRVFKDEACDSIVAIGGGAAIDVAKAIALMAHHPGHLFDYEDGKPDGRAVNQFIPDFIAIPTTAGTGSEVGRSAVISDDQTRAKKIIFSPRLLPQVALVDPELTVGLPPKVTAATGMDAMTHLIEAYLAKGFQPMCDGIALEGLRLLSQSLRTCFHKPDDIEARGMMMNAALMGAVAFQKGLGLNHSCAHALSTVCDLHHGLANGIMLPFTMAFNLKSSEQNFERLASVVTNYSRASSHASDGFLKWIRDVRQEIKIPAFLSEVGVTRNHLSDLVDVAVGDICHLFGPRKVGPKDFEEIFKAAIGAT